MTDSAAAIEAGEAASTRAHGRAPWRWWRVLVAVPMLALVLYAATNPVGPAPALGPLLDPVHGIWGTARQASLREELTASIPGLDGEVSVIYDRRGVPHIFARSEADAYRALGYVVARDRLFQLELQTRAAAGTLTELVGARAIEEDRRTRALGLPRAAERKLGALDSADAGLTAMTAYTDGVNAWIDGLSNAELPIEYHLLGARPARWSTINGVHLLNRMSWTLSFSNDDLSMLAARARVGNAAADALFPFDSPIQEPIQPSGRTSPRFALRRLPPPGAPDSAASALLDLALAAAPSLARRDSAPDDAIGSNNWAVAPRRTAAGRTLLAGDPHLDLTLPSIWYEAHLVVPGVLDVYGVTIPGAPTVIIGFNRDVAWTFTNGQADVVDYYTETVDDARAPSRYMLDESWRPLDLREERYLAPDGSLVGVDTVRYTHRGPLRRGPIGWTSMRWTAFEPSGETGNFVNATRARTVTEWMSAMATYVVPIQNMLVADRAGSIAIRATGAYPLRPGNGRGDIVRDGSSSASDWNGMRPVAGYPQSVNPAQGYLASANQQPVDPAVDPAYIGSNWYPPWRAMRINQLLRADSAVTVEAMRRYQTDPGSARADLFVPRFLAAARADSASGDLGRAAALLAEWDRRYTVDNERAVLFEYAMSDLARTVWDELRGEGEAARGGAPRPSETVLVELLEDPASVWWDVVSTPEIERRDDVLRSSLLGGLQRAEREHGDPRNGGWRWSGIQRANIRHLAGIPGFAAPPVAIQGGPSTLNPISGSGRFGASWRMVVELGDEVRGWGTYPGGQSGNPLSDRYDDRMTTWAAGELDSLEFPRTADAMSRAGVTGTLTLVPGR